MTIKDLWTRPHIARQMLAYHLDQDNHLASRPIAVIKEIIDWLDGEPHLSGKLADPGVPDQDPHSGIFHEAGPIGSPPMRWYDALSAGCRARTAAARRPEIQPRPRPHSDGLDPE